MKVFVECFADEKLIEFIGVNRKSIVHSQGKGDVINSLLKTSSSIAIGVIDEDPGTNQPVAFRNFIPVSNHPDMVLCEHKNGKNKKLIILKPKLEGWFYKAAKSVDINPTSFNLPNNPTELHKTPHYEKLNKFVDFLASLNNSPHFRKLRGWLCVYNVNPQL